VLGGESTAGETPLLDLESVSRTFDGGRIVGQAQTTLRVRRGELIAISGPSGSGKSTLLNLFCGIDLPTSGRVVFDGQAAPSPAAWARLRARRIGVISQDFNLLPALTAVENVEAAMFGRLRHASERRREALRRLDEVGIAHRANQRPPTLSGGERRRVAIARSLANDPDLILADEPTSNLDSATGAEVLALLLDLQRQRGMTLIIVTHDASVIARCPRRIRMLDARIVADDAGGERAA
jgi:putative ABC transport system ATP-binding protein